ncbi:MAG: MFS transporter [Cyanobacteria bacterium HKST-UBA02]|nr:MFS transporter [Cyanobacteria bacterium HKST-UBA02]
MENKVSAGSITVLAANTIAFCACFACWMMYGVLITFLVDNGIFHWDKAQMGWLIGIPVLTGSIIRLPIGVLTDQYGGRRVFTILMMLAAAAVYCVSFCNSYIEFLIAGLCFGISGASFAVGIAYTSVWFPRERQGTALGIFGAGNAGAAVTSLLAPHLLIALTDHMKNLDSWRMMPRIYSGVLLGIAILFFLVTKEKRAEHTEGLTMAQRLAPLKQLQVWRFGLYYFFVFGGFVALAQWLVPYYLNVYHMSLATAGLMASLFSLPSGVIRALGGWMSDLWGARFVMYFVLVSCLVACCLLSVPRMDIQSPGQGVMALAKGTVTSVDSSQIKVGEQTYKLRSVIRGNLLTIADDNNELIVWPTFASWQEPLVKVGDTVEKKQIIARGVTHIFFQANVWIFSALVLVIGIMTGIGKAAVYKHIPDYFPESVGVVGGIVGVLGGLGGFVGPIVFGELLKWTGIWTTCWISLTALVAVCLAWMHWTVTHMMNEKQPRLAKQFERLHSS